MKEGQLIPTQTVGIKNKNYPELLAQINDPPAQVYFRGELAICKQPALAVVGSRKFSTYGQLACEKIVGPLARLGVVIISGLALGIDGIAHQTALENDGRTLAVLGSGLDDHTIYPASHRQLAQKILRQGGLLLSEYPDKFQPTQYSFPQRNRLIAGLSLGTLIIEAAAKSGALITASCALDYNREVLAIPHPITAHSGRGTNNLIASGARLVRDHQDVLAALNLAHLTEKSARPEIKPENEIEQKIMEALSYKPKHIDLITKQTALDSSTVNGTLTLLEIRGAVKNLGGMTYIINN